MADNEEDIFADLYDGDETADAPPTTGAASPVKSVPPPPTIPHSATLPVEVPQQSTEAPSQAQPMSTLQQQVTLPGNGDGNGNFYQGETAANIVDYNGQFQNWQNQANNYDQNQQQFNGGPQDGDDQQSVMSKEDGKMFIGGLNWETTDQSLRDYFTQFGEVTECTVMRDAASGRSRGFGFLSFRDPKCVNIVMVKEHHLDGKIIDPKRAIPREEQERTAKIFVGGVSQEATEHDFKTFFQQFGHVLDATLMMDKDTGRPRGFGFVTFDNEAAVDRTLAGPLDILGKPIEVKKAQPRGNINSEDEMGRGRGRGRGQFGSNTGFSNNQAGPGGMMGMGGAMGGMPPSGMNAGAQMTPNMMAQYWTRMQQHFQMMQQQMMAAQQGGSAASGSGGTGPGGMTPQQMQMMQMQQMMMQQQQQQQQQNPGQSSTPQPQQQGTPQPDDDQSSQQDQQYMNTGAGSPYDNNGAGGSSAYEGMYDEGSTSQQSQPNTVYDENIPSGPMRGNGRNGGRNGGGRGFARGGCMRGGGGVGAAPAGAPTGPKNATGPSGPGGGMYRGGGRGGGRSYHPYTR